MTVSTKCTTGDVLVPEEMKTIDRSWHHILWNHMSRNVSPVVGAANFKANRHSRWKEKKGYKSFIRDL